MRPISVLTKMIIFPNRANPLHSNSAHRPQATVKWQGQPMDNWIPTVSMPVNLPRKVNFNFEQFTATMEWWQSTIDEDTSLFLLLAHLFSFLLFLFFLTEPFYNLLLLIIMDRSTRCLSPVVNENLSRVIAFSFSLSLSFVCRWQDFKYSCLFLSLSLTLFSSSVRPSFLLRFG